MADTHRPLGSFPRGRPETKHEPQAVAAVELGPDRFRTPWDTPAVAVTNWPGNLAT
jgi:hypothetical protein